MKSENYFSFFELPVAFGIDKKVLKRIFLGNTRKFHPDFFTMDTDGKKEEVLALSSYNNEAYKVLEDESKRIAYVLSILGAMEEEGKNVLAPSFLMEVMDLNEQIMDFKMDDNQEGLDKIQNEVSLLKNDLKSKRQDLMAAYDAYGEAAFLAEIKDLTMQLRYLRRMEQNINQEEVEL